MIVKGATLLRATAVLVAVATVVIGSGRRSSDYCATEGRLRVAPCCCIAIRDHAAPHLACCIPHSHMEPRAVAPAHREPLGTISPALAIAAALPAQEGNPTLVGAGDSYGTAVGDTGRVLHLRI